MTLHETKSSPIKQAASPDSTGWLSAKRKRALIPWLFLAPALIIFSWFKFIPMIQGLVMSFYKVNFNQPNEWVGLDNFTRAFADAELHAAVVNTLLYVVVTMFAAAILAFFLAMLLEGPARHLRFIRTAIFLPAVTSAAIVAEMWRILFNPTPNGVVNHILSWFGVARSGLSCQFRSGAGRHHAAAYLESGALQHGNFYCRTGGNQPRFIRCGERRRRQLVEPPALRHAARHDPGALGGTDALLHSWFPRVCRGVRHHRRGTF